MDVFIPKKMLVTGGAGFIGSNYIRYMLNNYSDLTIINLDKLTYAGSIENLNDLSTKNYQFVIGDICDDGMLRNLFDKFDFDSVVHFAAESHVDRSITGPKAFVETNIVGTFNLLDIAKNYWQSTGKIHDCRFHHISTDEVYGSLNKEDPAFTETTPYAPNSPYAASKASSDHLVRSYFHTYDLPIVTTNCSNNYGPYQHTEKLIPTIIEACLTQKSIPIYNDGSNIRDWLYVEDHCIALDTVLRKGDVGETYNIGGNNEKTNLEVVHMIIKIMDDLFPGNAPHKNLIKFVKDRPGHDFRYAINSAKIQNELGWKPKFDFENGITKTIEFYVHQKNQNEIPEMKIHG